MENLVQQIASFVNSWIMMIAFFTLQYYLVRKSQRWVSFILPAVYIIFAILNVVHVIWAGEIIVGGVVGTVLLTFFIGMMMPVLLLVVYFRREASLASTLIAVFFVYLAFELVFIFVVAVASAQVLQNDVEMNPHPNVVFEETLQEGVSL